MTSDKTTIAVKFRPSEIAVLMFALARVPADEARNLGREICWLGERFAKIHKQIVVDGGSEVAGTYGPQAWTVEEDRTAKTAG